YLESLRRLHGLGHRRVLPGHGPELDDVVVVSQDYLTHREERLEQVRAALRELGEDATARQVVEHVYTDVDAKLWDAAESSVRAQHDYLRCPRCHDRRAIATTPKSCDLRALDGPSAPRPVTM